MEQEILMEMKHIVVKFPGVIALNDVSISIGKASVHAVMGENGAGKSTLMKVLIGDRTPDCGEIFFEGKPIEKIASTGKQGHDHCRKHFYGTLSGKSKRNCGSAKNL